MADDLTKRLAEALDARIKQATIPDTAMPTFGGSVGHLFAATPYDLAVTAMAVVETELAERDALEAARCPSCDHLTTGHQQNGCWYPITGTPDRDLMCPCTVPAAVFAPTACRGCTTSLATCWAEGARCCDACAHPKDTP